MFPTPFIGGILLIFGTFLLGVQASCSIGMYSITFAFVVGVNELEDAVNTDDLVPTAISP